MTEPAALMRLQELDLELLKHASTLSAMPQRKRLQTIELASRKVAAERKGSVGQRKGAQPDVPEAEEPLGHYRAKTAEVQAEADAGEHTHREISSFEQQLTSLAKRIEKSEFTLGPLRERLERLERAERNARLTAERLEAERATTQAELEEASRDLRARIVTLSREREQVAAELPAALLERYEAARKRFKGLGVERLSGNVPSVCRVTLQPIALHALAHQEIRRVQARHVPDHAQHRAVHAAVALHLHAAALQLRNQRADALLARLGLHDDDHIRTLSSFPSLRPAITKKEAPAALRRKPLHSVRIHARNGCFTRCGRFLVRRKSRSQNSYSC